MGVIVKEAVANGRLTGRAAPPELSALAGELGAAPDAVAIAAVLAQPWADMVLSGASTPEMLASNLRALELELDADALARLDSLAEPAGAYWSARAELAWN
jgi:aryl-alcohol dehydrogenase-like predicted oxidoreductase